MILLVYIIVPSAAALLAWLLGRRRPAVARWTAVAGMAVPLAVAAVQWVTSAGDLTAALSTTGSAASLFQGGVIADVRGTWIPQLGISLYLAEDGLTLILLSLTFGLGLVGVLASWKSVEQRVGTFHLFLLWTAAGLAGAFLAFDLFLFYFFYEMMLVPMYFIIALWGYERRVYAAIKFFIFTQIGGLLMLVAILALAFIHERATGLFTFDVTQLLHTPMSSTTAMLLMLGFFAAFAVKLPAFPLHTWLPDAHTEAPTAGSVILAGVLIKVGAYGFIRFLVPLFPQAAFDFRTVAMVLAVIGIIYGAVMAYGQRDMKRLVAYTSVSHMGFVLLGVFAWNTLALQGAILEIVCHAFSTGALFLLVGSLQERIHTRDMAKMGGLWTVAPKMGGTAMFFALASLGLPGLGNFVAEFLILQGTWQVSEWAAVLGAVGLVFATVYALWMIQRAFHGEESHGWSFADLGRRELGVFAVMIGVLVLLGFYPQPLFDTVQQPVAGLQEVTRTGPAATADGAAPPSADPAAPSSSSAGVEVASP